MLLFVLFLSSLAAVWIRWEPWAVAWELKENDWEICSKFTPNGQYIVTGTNDGWIKVRDARNGNNVASTQLYSISSVQGIDISKDGSKIAACGPSGALVWEFGSGRHLELQQHAYFDFIAFSPDTRRILAITGDTSTCIVFTDSGIELSRFPITHGKRTAFLPDGASILARHSESADLCLWDADKGMKKSSLLENTDFFKTFYTSNGNRVSAYVWEKDASKPDHIIPIVESDYSRACVSPDGSELLIIHDNTAEIRRLPSCAMASKISWSQDEQAFDTFFYSPHPNASYASDGRRVLLISRSGKIIACDSHSLKLICLFDLPLKSDRKSTIAGDGNRVFSSFSDGTLLMLYRRHPEWWWGHFQRPEVWVAIFLGSLLVWHIYRNLSTIRTEPSKSIEGFSGKHPAEVTRK